MQDFHSIINENGRLVIPVAIRKKLNLKAGDKLVVNISEDNDIIIHNPKQSLNKIRNILKQKSKKKLSEELINIRRKEII